MIKSGKNFFQEYWVYILLGIFSFGLLGVEVYRVFFDRSESVVAEQNGALKEENQTKKVLDPVIDNIYWLIASFVVYYSVYLGLKYSDYKDQTFWVIPSLVVLGKIGLIVFSSFYYQKNSFLQNLNKSINPDYFIHQGVAQIIISLIGYIGLAVLVYYGSKKPKQKRRELINQIRRNNILAQEADVCFKKAIDLAIKYINNVDKCFKDALDSLQDKGFLNLDQFINSIENSIQVKKINYVGVKNLVSSVEFIQPTMDSDNFFSARENCYKIPLFNCLISYISFFIGKNDDDTKKEIVDVFLNEIIKDPSNEKILSLKTLINERFYLTNCIRSLYFVFFSLVPFSYMVNKNIFKTAEEVQNFHLRFLRTLIKRSKTENLFQQKVDDCQDVQKFYEFFIDEQIKNKVICAISSRDFLALLKELETQQN